MHLFIQTLKIVSGAQVFVCQKQKESGWEAFSSLNCLYMSAPSESHIICERQLLIIVKWIIIFNNWEPLFYVLALSDWPGGLECHCKSSVPARSNRASVGHNRFCPCKDIKPTHGWVMGPFRKGLTSVLYLYLTRHCASLCRGKKERERWHLTFLSPEFFREVDNMFISF